MQKILTYRMLNAINVVMAIIAMTFALLYLQKHLGLSPCPLCVFQRIGLMVMGVFSFVALLINPKNAGHSFFYGSAVLLASLGLRQWQHDTSISSTFPQTKYPHVDQV